MNSNIILDNKSKLSNKVLEPILDIAYERAGITGIIFVRATRGFRGGGQADGLGAPICQFTPLIPKAHPNGVLRGHRYTDPHFCAMKTCMTILHEFEHVSAFQQKKHFDSHAVPYRQRTHEIRARAFADDNIVHIPEALMLALKDDIYSLTNYERIVI